MLHFLMIIGLPDENLRTLNNTFKYLVKLRPESIGFSTLTPYPGTKMFEDANKAGLITNFNWEDYNGNHGNMRTKYLTKIDLKLMRYILLSTSYGIKHKSPLGNLIVILDRMILRIWQTLRRE